MTQNKTTLNLYSHSDVNDWASYQRKRYAQRKLNSVGIARCEAIPGWSWTWDSMTADEQAKYLCDMDGVLERANTVIVNYMEEEMNWHEEFERRAGQNDLDY